MNGRFGRNLQHKKFSDDVRSGNLMRVPFWFSSSNYYVLTFGIALVLFFAILFISEAQSETSILFAGFTGAGILIFAAMLRGVLLKRRRKQIILINEFHKQINSVTRNQANSASEKLTIEKNALILSEIEKKSKAAIVLENLPQAHLEVFEFCDEYLRKNLRELQSVGMGSPRIPILKKSKETVEKYHKYHLLSWASLESRLLIKDAQDLEDFDAQLDYSARALKILDSASEFYPNEKVLSDSAIAVKSFILNLKLNRKLTEAEEFAIKENYNQAINSYKEILFFLTRGNERTREKDLIAEKVNNEIFKLERFINKS